VFLWLESKNPAQEWHATIVFAGRRLEPPEKSPYRALLESGRVTRVYLEELPEAAENQIGLGILQLIVAPLEAVVARARTWLKRIPRSGMSVAQRKKTIELVEMIVLGHFPGLSRRELEEMLQIKDFRETRVYKEALEEGIDQGLEKGMEKGMEKGRELEREQIALRLLDKGLAATEIADVTGLSVQRIRSLKRKNGKA
jgi:predicted transposase/invertase (TIGR01784 family)